MVTRRGAAGVCVASHVTEELRLVIVHVPIPRQHMEDETAFHGNWDQLLKLKDATRSSAQVFCFAQHISHNMYMYSESDLKVSVVNNLTQRNPCGRVALKPLQASFIPVRYPFITLLIIPPLRHFTILGQKNAQNMPRYYTVE